MRDITFIIGGCRSGKSRYALEYAESQSENGRIFIATCVPNDDEMKARVARHQEERGVGWSTIEEPIHLPEAITEYGRKGNLLLVDCLTLWVSNLLMQQDENEMKSIYRVALALELVRCPVILVSNEVGTGIVPENALARHFRDIVGQANQTVAACADRVVWMVAGIPVQIKPGKKIL